MNTPRALRADGYREGDAAIRSSRLRISGASGPFLDRKGVPLAIGRQVADPSQVARSGRAVHQRLSMDRERVGRQRAGRPCLDLLLGAEQSDFPLGNAFRGAVHQHLT
jgi:hypothetical protein